MKKSYNVLSVMFNRFAAFVSLLRTKAVWLMKGFKKKNVAEHRFEKPTSFKIILSENSGEIYKMVKDGMSEDNAFKHLQVSLTLQDGL